MSIRFLYNNDIFDACALSATSSAEGHPVENLKDQRRKETHRFAELLNQYYSMDMGAGYGAGYGMGEYGAGGYGMGEQKLAANAIALVDHNLTAEGTFRLTATDNPDFITDLILDELFDAWETVWGAGEGGAGEHGAGGYPTEAEIGTLLTGTLRVFYFNLVQARYWRLYPSDPNNGDGYLELGRPIITTDFELLHQFAYGWGFTPQDRSKVQYTKGGQPTVFEKEKRYIMDFVFPRIKEEEKWQEFLEMMASYGIRKDMVIQVFPDASGCKKFYTTLYGRFEASEPFLERAQDISQLSLKFIESL